MFVMPIISSAESASSNTRQKKCDCNVLDVTTSMSSRWVQSSFMLLSFFNCFPALHIVIQKLNSTMKSMKYDVFLLTCCKLNAAFRYFKVNIKHKSVDKKGVGVNKASLFTALKRHLNRRTLVSFIISTAKLLKTQLFFYSESIR